MNVISHLFSEMIYNKLTVHVTGQISGGSDFEANNGLYLRWRLVDDRSITAVDKTEDGWHLLRGSTSGQTQVSTPDDIDSFALWQHPIDVHFALSSIRGWPRLYVEVWALDEFRRHELAGYGFVHVPTASGCFDLDIVTCVPESKDPIGRLSEDLVGGLPKLKDPTVLLRSGSRLGLNTKTTGIVHVELQLLHRGFNGTNIKFSS